MLGQAACIALEEVAGADTKSTEEYLEYIKKCHKDYIKGTLREAIQQRDAADAENL